MKAKLQEDIKVAMKAREEKRLLVLRGLMSEFKREEIDTRKDLTEERAVAIVQKEIKKRRDTIEFAQKGGRADAVQEAEMEIQILQGYLGEQLSADKLREIISGLIGAGADSIGKIMGGLNKDYKGKFEGKVASEIAQQLLQK